MFMSCKASYKVWIISRNLIYAFKLQISRKKPCFYYIVATCQLPLAYIFWHLEFACINIVLFVVASMNFIVKLEERWEKIERSYWSLIQFKEFETWFCSIQCVFSDELWLNQHLRPVVLQTRDARNLRETFWAKMYKLAVFSQTKVYST